MAHVKPFSAYRPKSGLENTLAALPYDVYNREEATEFVKKHPDSFLAIDRAETFFDTSVDTYDPIVYKKARQVLDDKIKNGAYVKDNKPCYYLYQETMDGRSQTGIVACASIDDYMNNVIKKHENSRTDKELDRINHVDTLDMQTGPIFLAYKSNEKLKAIIADIKKRDCAYDFVSEDGVGHKAWIVSDDKEIEAISECFAQMDSLYIADGHHRCASAVKVGLKRREENPGFKGDEEFNFILSVIFDASELKIMDYNRVVKDLNGLSEAEFLNKLSEKFEVKEVTDSSLCPYKPAKKGEFGMYLSNKWYVLTLKDKFKRSDCVESLDVSYLQDYVLTPVLGIKDPKTDKRIDFIGGIRGLKELERRVATDMKLAFSMYPTDISELFGVADEKKLMPPKSTWFEPKLRSGLFLHDISKNQ
ncbi:MAG: DUF1015 family protein [Lachnospiraceae bacterium]|nr:DUF1015 family protein [Lachnospiraceae bacterium]